MYGHRPDGRSADLVIHGTTAIVPGRNTGFILDRTHYGGHIIDLGGNLAPGRRSWQDDQHIAGIKETE